MMYFLLIPVRICAFLIAVIEPNVCTVHDKVYVFAAHSIYLLSGENQWQTYGFIRKL